MKIFVWALLTLVPLSLLAETEAGRIDAPRDAREIQITSFSETKIPGAQGLGSVPGYDLTIGMTSMTEGDCDPTAPAGDAGSCTEPRDVEKDLFLRADALPAIPHLSKWSDNVKTANRLFRLQFVAGDDTQPSQIIVFSK